MDQPETRLKSANRVDRSNAGPRSPESISLKSWRGPKRGVTIQERRGLLGRIPRTGSSREATFAECSMGRFSRACDLVAGC
jgi:hypothetical protein